MTGAETGAMSHMNNGSRAGNRDDFSAVALVVPYNRHTTVDAYV